MGDPGQVKAVIKSIKQYSNFRQMAEYNISCLLTYITPPTVGWRENVAAAVDEEGIENIIQVLGKHGNALDMVKQATTALSGLAISRENAGRVAENGGIEKALQCMLQIKRTGGDEEAVINSGSKLMETVARFNPESIIKAPHAVASMLQGVQYVEIPRVQTASAKVLDRIGVMEAGVQMIVKQDGIKALVNAIAPEKPTHEAMLRPIFRLLERLARTPEYVQQIRAAGGVEALVAQLDAHSDNEFILRAGGRLLAKIADGDIEETIRKMGMKLPDAVRQHLVGLIANLALQPENVEKIVRSNGIEALLRNFNNYNAATKAVALRAIQRIADAGEQYVQRIIAAGGLPIIVNAIRNSNGDEEILKAATQALTSMAGAGLGVANAIHAQGGIQAVLDAMRQYPDQSGFIAAGLEFIERLTAVGFDSTELVQMGAVDAILMGMNENMDSGEVQESGFKALSGLMNGSDLKTVKFAAETIAANGRVNVLPEALQTHQDDKAVVRAGVDTLAKLVSIDTVRGAMSKLGAVDAIVAAIYAQMKLEMHGFSRLSGDPAYIRNVKTVLSSLVQPADVGGLANAVIGSNPDLKAVALKRVAVFSLSNEYAAVLMNQNIGQALTLSLQKAISTDVRDEGEEIVNHAVAIWAMAKSGLDAMGDLSTNGAPKELLSAAKVHVKEKAAVIAGYRSLIVFANNPDYKTALFELGTIENCVVGMRSNAQEPDVQLAAITLMLSLGSSDAGASQVCYRGGVTQINKMVKDSSTNVEFEKAIEKALQLLYRVSTVEKGDVREQLKKQGTVNVVTIAMSAFPTNEEILEKGARILGLLMDEQDVANAIDDVAKLTMDLQATKKPDPVFEQLGQKAATVGFLSLNPRNKVIMEKKNAIGVTDSAIKVSKTKPQNVKREVAVMNEFRALGQIASIAPYPAGTVESLLKNLTSQEDQVALMEKVGILDGMKYMCQEPNSLTKFHNLGAVDSVLDLLSKNRSEDRFLQAALDALAGLMANKKGVQLVTAAGGRDLVLSTLRDDGENLSPRAAESALVALKKLAELDSNVPELVKEGVVDSVASGLAIQCEQSDEPRPRVVGAAAALLTELTKDETATDQIVKKGALKKIIEIAMSSADYLADPGCFQNIAHLLEALSQNEDLLPKLRELGAVDLVMAGMNLNPGNEDLETSGQKILQRLIGGDASALEQTLKEYDRLLNQVKVKPVGNATGLERLNRAGINLGNLMMVQGVVDAAGAKEIVARAMETYDVVEKIPDSVGPVKEHILETALNNIGKCTLIDGAMDAVDLGRALDLLSKAMGKNSSPQMQIQSLGALGKFLQEDEKVVAHAVKFGIIEKLQEVISNTASPEVRAAAEDALNRIRDKVAKNPGLILNLGPAGDQALADILKGISDPKDLDDLLNRITDAPYGADALLRIAMMDLNNPDSPMRLSDDIRQAILKALTQAPPGVLTIPPELLGELFKRLQDPTVDPDEKAALLRLIGETRITPATSQALLLHKAPETLLDLLANENTTDPALMLAALNALAQMSKDKMLGKRILDLNGPQTITEAMKRFAGDKNIQKQGFDALANLSDTAGGPVNISLSPDALNYLEDALNGLDPGQRQRANKFLTDLMNAYNGEVEPMVISRFDNMLELLNAAKVWKTYIDPKTGKPYYYNTVTKETTWEKPAAIIAAENALKHLQQLAEKSPADIDSAKLEAAIGHLRDQITEPLRLKALAKALTALATNENNRDAMVKHGVLDALIKALNGQSVDREFILAAIALLNQFAKHPVFKEQICRLGGIKALIAIMLRFMADAEIVEKCEQCLANLAFNSELCIAEIMNCEGPQAVRTALSTHKEFIPVNLNAMSLLSNLMYQNLENKQKIGDLLRDKIIAVLRRMYKDAPVLKQTARALGNIAFIDEHIRYAVRLNAVKSLVVAMNHHTGDNSILKLGIDVIGNFASINEEDYEQQIQEGHMVSVISTIWHEGGAKMIVDTFGKTTDDKIVTSCIKSLTHLLEDLDVRKKLIGMRVVPMIFSTIRKYEFDADISDFCIDSIELLSQSYEGIKSIYDNDGISTLLQQMDLNKDRGDYVYTLTQALVNMSNLRDVNKDLSMRILNDMAQQDGIETLVRVMEQNQDDEKFVRVAMRLLMLMTALRSDISQRVAEKAMRVILDCANAHAKNVQVLITAYQLIGLLAFEEKNLKIIVQYGGITLIVNSILAFPENEALVKRSIRTLDNIAMASQEHSNIVKEAQGKTVIEELIKTYETISGPKAEEVVNACKAALLSLNKIETRKLKRQLFFTNKEEADPNADPLKNHRNLLRTGETMTWWKSGSTKQVHLMVTENLQIVWKAPGQRKRYGKVDLKNHTGTRAGNNHGHGRRSVAQHAFAIVSAEAKNPFCFECRDEDQRTRWVDALEALRTTYRSNNRKWLYV